MDYDSSSVITPNHSKPLDKAVIFLLQGFRKWDSVYFLQIAEHGYQYEQYMAFFPLYPWLMRALSIPLYCCLGRWLSFSNVLLLVGCGLSSICFAVAAIFLYKLSLKVLRNERLAFFSCFLFCINPANVFMSSVYTESLFAACLFCGLYFLGKSDSFTHVVIASIALSFGSGTRSNGVVSCGFVTHSILRMCVCRIFSQITPMLMVSQPSLNSLRAKAIILSSTAFELLISNFIILLPFMAYQYYGYHLYCQSLQDVNIRPPLPWCGWKLPLSYSYIQNHYWNVGFMKYFELKQIPNFILASPMVLLCVAAIVEFICNKGNIQFIKTLGLWRTTENETYRKCQLESGENFHHPGVFVYIAYVGFLTLFGVTSVHVQVITRLIASSSPVPYWYAAYLITSQQPDDNEWCKLGIRKTLLLGYFITYLTLGILLHCNFYPWT